jgi:hypothetical protein
MQLEDLVTVHALRYGLRSDVDADRAGQELAAVAHGRQAVLRRVHRRIEVAVDERPSAVGQRALEALEAALGARSGAG